jgi:beta-mannosidase
LADYYLRKKPAFYTIARCLAPVAVGVQREYRDWSVMHARPAKTTRWTLWVASSRLESFEAQVEVRFVSIKTGKEIKPTWKKTCKVVPNGTTAVLEGETQNEREEPHVLAARIVLDGVCIARDTDWPQPLKYHSFEDRGLVVTKSGRKLRVSVERPVKALVVEEIDGVKLSDNCLDVVPGDEQTIEIKEGDVDAGSLVWRHLGCEEGLRGAPRESKI